MKRHPGEPRIERRRREALLDARDADVYKCRTVVWGAGGTHTGAVGGGRRTQMGEVARNDTRTVVRGVFTERIGGGGRNEEERCQRRIIVVGRWDGGGGCRNKDGGGGSRGFMHYVPATTLVCRARPSSGQMT